MCCSGLRLRLGKSAECASWAQQQNWSVLIACCSPVSQHPLPPAQPARVAIIIHTRITLNWFIRLSDCFQHRQLVVLSFNCRQAFGGDVGAGFLQTSRQTSSVSVCFGIRDGRSWLLVVFMAVIPMTWHDSPKTKCCQRLNPLLNSIRVSYTLTHYLL